MDVHWRVCVYVRRMLIVLRPKAIFVDQEKFTKRLEFVHMLVKSLLNISENPRLDVWVNIYNFLSYF